MTLINDVKHDAANPDYSGAPVTFALPKDPPERGEDPKPGLRMKLDTKTREIVIYDPAAKSHEEDHLHPHRLEGKCRQKQAPWWWKRNFPIVDKDKKAITVDSGRQKLYDLLPAG